MRACGKTKQSDVTFHNCDDARLIFGRMRDVVVGDSSTPSMNVADGVSLDRNFGSELNARNSCK